MGSTDKILTLIGSDIESKDSIQVSELEGMNFHDLTDFLYKKYGESILSYVSSEMDYFVSEVERAPIRFFYFDDYGQMIVLERSEQVLDVMKVGDTIHWEIFLMVA